MARVIEPRERRVALKIDAHRQDIEALRKFNLSYRAIAVALEHFRGITFSAEQVAYALARWGEPPRSSKARA
jgi:hypothetical protein